MLDDLICVTQIRYQICLKRDIKLIKKYCMKLIKECIPQTYSGEAYISVDK